MPTDPTSSTRGRLLVTKRAVVDVVLCGDDRYYWVLKDGRSRAERVFVDAHASQ